LAVAGFYHKTQKHKGTKIPYMSHLMAVSAIVREAGGTRDQQVAAVLHDVVEDTDATIADIRRLFGSNVAKIVRACSDTETLPKPPWLSRKQRYIRHLARVPNDVILVSLADKVHNARCILADYQHEGSRLWTRLNKESMGAAGQLWYYRELVSAFAIRRQDLAPKSRYLVASLAGVVATLEAEVAVREPSAIGKAQRVGKRR
jgi:(p)ppGpp synthase/HD superfamily hydrolase